MSKYVSKEILLEEIFRKFEGKISQEIISNVISIFVAEFNCELREKGEVKIGNFCDLSLKKTSPRPYHHYWKKEILMSKGRNILKIKLNYKLRKRIIRHLNIFKTFEEV